MPTYAPDIETLMHKLMTMAVALVILCGCTTNPFLNAGADGLLTIGITEGLKRGVPDSARRANIAKYADDIAKGLRTVSGNQTSAQLSTYLLGFVPAHIRTEYPELATLVLPFIIGEYQAAQAKYGSNFAPTYAVLNRVAADVENAVAPFITQT